MTRNLLDVKKSYYQLLGKIDDIHDFRQSTFQTYVNSFFRFIKENEDIRAFFHKYLIENEELLEKNSDVESHPIVVPMDEEERTSYALLCLKKLMEDDEDMWLRIFIRNGYKDGYGGAYESFFSDVIYKELKKICREIEFFIHTEEEKKINIDKDPQNIPVNTMYIYGGTFHNSQVGHHNTMNTQKYDFITTLENNDIRINEDSRKVIIELEKEVNKEEPNHHAIKGMILDLFQHSGKEITTKIVDTLSHPILDNIKDTILKLM